MLGVLPKFSLFVSGVGIIGGTQLVSSPSTQAPHLTSEAVKERLRGESELIQQSREEIITETLVEEVPAKELNSRLIQEALGRTPKGNCSVIDNLEQVIKELKLTSPYIAVSCRTQGDSSYGILGDKWTGLLPLSFLKQDKWGFNKGREIDVITKTDYANSEEEDNNEDSEEVALFDTIFSSTQFIDPEIVGGWDYGTKEYDGKLVDFVTLKKPQVKEKIYFVHVD